MVQQTFMVYFKNLLSNTQSIIGDKARRNSYWHSLKVCTKCRFVFYTLFMLREPEGTQYKRISAGVPDQPRRPSVCRKFSLSLFPFLPNLPRLLPRPEK